jgi:LAS superfamily LD-carboxypeptidase LdcB
LNYYSDRPEKIHPDTLTALQKMEKDLQQYLADNGYPADFGIFSGYRSIKEQKPLFFDSKHGNPRPPGVNEDDVITPEEAKILQANSNARQRAESSAPPGYSEHHSGFAFDFGLKGVAGRPDEIETWQHQGAYQKAYNWLKTNAHQYGFEQSFTGQNGLQEEPWHWRWVGNSAAANVFKLVRKTDQPLTPLS